MAARPRGSWTLSNESSDKRKHVRGGGILLIVALSAWRTHRRWDFAKALASSYALLLTTFGRVSNKGSGATLVYFK